MLKKSIVLDGLMGFIEHVKNRINDMNIWDYLKNHDFLIKTILVVISIFFTAISYAKSNIFLVVATMASMFYIIYSSRTFLSFFKYFLAWSMVFFIVFTKLLKLSMISPQSFIFTYFLFFFVTLDLFYAVYLLNKHPIKAMLKKDMVFKSLFDSSVLTFFFAIVIYFVPVSGVFNLASAFFGSYFLLYFFGEYSLIFLMLFFSFLFARYAVSKENFIFSTKIFLVALLLIYSTNMLFEERADANDVVSVGVVQRGVIPGEQEANDSLNLKIYSDETKKLFARNERIDFVVWPEYSFYRFLDDGSELRSKIQAFSNQMNITIVLGAQSRIAGVDSDKISYNAVFVFRPFGEQEAFNSQTPYPFDKTTLPSPIKKDIWHFGNYKIGLLSCYEETVNERIRNYNDLDADFMIVLSNNNFPDPLKSMTLSYAKLQAAKSMRYFVRVTKTGYTVMINSNGDVVRSIEPESAGSDIFDVRIINRESPYRYYGDSLFMGLLLAFMAYYLFSSGFSLRK